MVDQLGPERQLVAAVRRQPWQFGQLVDQTRLPAVARTHTVHLHWHRRMAVDLAQPFGDGTWAYPVGRA